MLTIQAAGLPRVRWKAILVGASRKKSLRHKANFYALSILLILMLVLHAQVGEQKTHCRLRVLQTEPAPG